MADLDDLERLANALPEVEEGTTYGRRAWKVGGKTFAWERAFSKADLKRFGDEEPPEGPIAAVAVDDLADKEAILQAGHPGVFTIPHFDGYPAVLIQLSAIDDQTLAELVDDGWLAVAPAPLVERYRGDGAL